MSKAHTAQIVRSFARLAPPMVSDRWLRRPELTARLDHFQGIVLAAPAGYGKTTLAAQYAAEHRSCGWLGLPNMQETLSVVLALLVEAWLGDDDIDDPILQQAVQAGFEDPYILLEHLAAALIAQGRPRLLVLDGADVLTDVRLLQALPHFIELLPSYIRCLVTVRNDEALAWHTLYVAQKACRLDCRDLQWQAHELDAALKARGLSMDDATRRWLSGWPAAISVWLNSDGRWGAERSGFNRSSLLDYCLQERIRSLSPEARDLVFNHAAAENCLLAKRVQQLGERAESVIAELLNNSIAEVRDDGELSCLVFSGMVRDAVEKYLQQRQPAELLSCYAGAAQDWLDRGQFLPALDFAIRARDLTLLQTVLGREGWNLYLNGQVAIVRQAVLLLEPVVSDLSPELLLLYLKIHLLCGERRWRTRSAAEWSALLQRVLPQNAERFGLDERRRFRAGLACIQVQRALALADEETALMLAEELLPPETPDGLQAAAWACQAELVGLAGDLTQAEGLWQRALQRARQQSHKQEELWYTHQLAETRAARGDARGALVLRQEAMAFAETHGLLRNFAYWCLLRGYVELCLQLRFTDEAARQLERVRSWFEEQDEAAVAIDLLRARWAFLVGDRPLWESLCRSLAGVYVYNLHPYLRVRLYQVLVDRWSETKESERLRVWLDLLSPLNDAKNPVAQFDGRNRLRALAALSRWDEFRRLSDLLRRDAAALPVDAALLEALIWEFEPEDIRSAPARTWRESLLQFGHLAELRRLASTYPRRWDHAPETDAVFPSSNAGAMAVVVGQDSTASLALDSRDRQLLQSLEEGLSNEWIAERMNLAVGTVKNRLSHLYRKIGVENRSQAVAWWIRHR